MRDPFGRMKRYSEKTISQDPKLIKTLSSLDAHDLGYRVGYRAASQLKQKVTGMMQGCFSKVLRRSK